MTGNQFEEKFCEAMSKQGFWVLRIPRGAGGTQPFDVIAIGRNIIFAVDCKVVSGKANTFSLDRVEDNQWLAFELITERTNAIAMLAIYWEKEDCVKIIQYPELIQLKNNGNSTHLKEKVTWFEGFSK